jgi:hypothetical protein
MAMKDYISTMDDEFPLYIGILVISDAETCRVYLKCTDIYIKPTTHAQHIFLACNLSVQYDPTYFHSLSLPDINNHMLVPTLQLHENFEPPMETLS